MTDDFPPAPPGLNHILQDGPDGCPTKFSVERAFLLLYKEATEVYLAECFEHMEQISPPAMFTGAVNRLIQLDKLQDAMDATFVVVEACYRGAFPKIITGKKVMKPNHFIGTIAFVVCVRRSKDYEDARLVVI